MDRVLIFVAYGTRGDVLPIACLAQQHLLELQQSTSVFLITHASHEEWLSVAPFSKISSRIQYVPSLPARRWGDGLSGEKHEEVLMA